jgi:hypothetical protein
MPPKFTPTVDLQKGERHVDDRLLSVCLYHHSHYQFDHDYDGESIERFWTKYQKPAECSEMQNSEGAEDAQAKVGFYFAH